MQKGWIDFSITYPELGEILNQLQCLSIFLNKLKLCIHKDNLKKHYSPMEKGRIEFSIKTLEPGGNQMNQMAMFKYFSK